MEEGGPGNGLPRKAVWVTKDHYNGLFDLKCEKRFSSLDEVIGYLLSLNAGGTPHSEQNGGSEEVESVRQE